MWLHTLTHTRIYIYPIWIPYINPYYHGEPKPLRSATGHLPAFDATFAVAFALSEETKSAPGDGSKCGTKDRRKLRKWLLNVLNRAGFVWLGFKMFYMYSYVNLSVNYQQVSSCFHPFMSIYHHVILYDTMCCHFFNKCYHLWSFAFISSKSWRPRFILPVTKQCKKGCASDFHEPGMTAYSLYVEST